MLGFAPISGAAISGDGSQLVSLDVSVAFETLLNTKSATLTVNAPIEISSRVARDASSLVEWANRTSIALNAGAPIEVSASVFGRTVAPFELISVAIVSANVGAPIEALSDFAKSFDQPIERASLLTTDLPAPLQSGQGVTSLFRFVAERTGGVVAGDASAPSDWTAGRYGETFAPFETASIANVSITVAAPIETVTAVARDSIMTFETVSGIERHATVPNETLSSISGALAQSPLEFVGQLIVQVDSSAPLAWSASITRDVLALAERIGSVVSDRAAPAETVGSVTQTAVAPFELTAVSLTRLDCAAPLDWTTIVARDASAPAERTVGVSSDATGNLETLHDATFEMRSPFDLTSGATVFLDGTSPLEWQSSIFPVSIDVAAPLEIYFETFPHPPNPGGTAVYTPSRVATPWPSSYALSARGVPVLPQTLVFPGKLDGDTLDYAFDATAILAEVNETLRAVRVEASPNGPGELVIEALDVDPTGLAVVWLSGGVTSRTYLIRFFLTSLTRTLEGIVQLTVGPITDDDPTPPPFAGYGPAVTWVAH